jgi:hypothetical protein
MTWRKLGIVTALVVVAAAYYEASFDNTFSATNRFRIILAMLFLQAIAVVLLAALLAQVLADLRSHHRAASQVAILRGLWKTLQAGTADGGELPVGVRQRVYAAGEEAFESYDGIMGRNLGTARSGLVLRFQGREQDPAGEAPAVPLGPDG